MSQFLLIVAVALTVGAIAFGITVLLSSGQDGLRRVEPDGVAVPLPTDRPLVESDVAEVRFDTGLRGYRMVQVDAALRRAAYDIGYKDELIRVLQAEIDALRDGRESEADALRRSREAALAAAESAGVTAGGTAEITLDVAGSDAAEPAPEEAPEPAPEEAAEEAAEPAATEEAPEPAAGSAAEPAAEPASETGETPVPGRSGQR